MSNRLYEVGSTAEVVVPIQIETSGDPTAGAVEFSFTAKTATDPGSFTAGSWSGSFDATTGMVTALTPTLPTTGADVELAEGRYKVWARWTVGGETVVVDPGLLDVG